MSFMLNSIIVFLNNNKKMSQLMFSLLILSMKLSWVSDGTLHTNEPQLFDIFTYYVCMFQSYIGAHMMECNMTVKQVGGYASYQTRFNQPIYT